MSNDTLNITWMGTASVKLETEQTKVLIDPFVELPGAENPNTVDDFLGADAILITHGHIDHLSSLPDILEREVMRGRGTADRGAVGTGAGSHGAPNDDASKSVSANANNRLPHVYCTQTPARTLRRMTFNYACNRHLPEYLHVVSPGDVFEIGDIAVRVLPGQHIKFDAELIEHTLTSPRMWQMRTSLPQTMRLFTTCPENGETVIFEVSAAGRRILDMGSLGLADGINYPQGADLLLMPYQGNSDLVAHARPVLERLRPRKVALTHFDDAFPPLSATVDTRDIMMMTRQEFPGIPVLKPVAGETFTLE